MRETRWQIGASIRPGFRLWFAALLLALALIASVAAGTARANLGYELNASTPFKSLGAKGPHGIAVDQGTRRIYVAIATNNFGSGTPGEIDLFESDLSVAGTFTAGGGPFYTGVAVNPLTHGVYAAQAVIHTPFGNFGAAKMNLFSSSGTPGATFALSDTHTFPQIATDSTGDVYFPNATKGTVQVFNSAGVLQEEISCSGCPGGSSFSQPVTVALNGGDLYVVDLGQDRVVKLTSSGGGPYTFASVLQSGRGAAAVSVDPSNGDVFVGDLPGGTDYHIVAYHSSAAQFDDFGAGLFSNPPSEVGAIAAQQMAVDATSHRLYVGDTGKFYVFDKGTISPPTAAVNTATPVGQIAATLRATVNAKGHAVLDCEFEYTDDLEFQAHGFTGADMAPCSVAPDGSSDTLISAKISGLSPVTVYHYRVTAASNAGSVTSGEETFTTLPVTVSTVTTKPASSIGESFATLNGTVNPHGGSASDCHFEYGPSALYGTNLPCAVLPAPVTTDVDEARKVLKLAAGTTYHYRLVVTSNAGTTKGEDVAFTTASPPPPPQAGQPPVSPPPVTLPPPTTTPPPASHPLRCKKGFRKKRVRGKLKCVKRKRHAKRGTRRR